MRDELVARAPAGEPGSANDQTDADPAIEQAGLGRWEGETVVGREDNKRALVEAGLLKRVEHAPDAVVERARTRLVGGDVLADLRRVGQKRRRQRIDPIPDGAGLEEAPMRLEKPDRHEERLADAAAQRLDRGRAHRVHASVGDLVHDVIPEHVRIGGDVLLADQLGVVAVGVQHPHELMVVVVQREPACASPIIPFVWQYSPVRAPRENPSTTGRHRRRCGT